MNKFLSTVTEKRVDFCYVENAVQANILSALSQKKSKNNVYNIAFGERTTLIDLFNSLKSELTKNQKDYILEPKYSDFVRHSQADISKAKNMLCMNHLILFRTE